MPESSRRGSYLTAANRSSVWEAAIQFAAPGAPSPARSASNIEDSLVADFIKNRDDIQAKMLRETAEAFRRGNKVQARANRDLYYCGLVSMFPSGSRFQTACEYLRALDRPGVPSGAASEAPSGKAVSRATDDYSSPSGGGAWPPVIALGETAEGFTGQVGALR